MDRSEGERSGKTAHTSPRRREAARREQARRDNKYVSRLRKQPGFFVRRGGSEGATTRGGGFFLYEQKETKNSHKGCRPSSAR